ncbi:hypothetical protein HMJ29_06950 [Hymenobacter taeanensis]|uniref:Heavy metal binding domain-containing protein n=1 Tax=Hymenobacter taeanensis TaxID=2735321 RepID=A0A6M6BBM0_9BACT|nr:MULTISPECIES: heavy metal-binding domain-containing protein [Hymenobacter]QJX45399.1 hypothetical protein HMJ29_06950 [Hymenobacter taeanensis]UOQ80555.1 hypothetical protein MUN83_17295 [Hymenobacter sp. 5414T-23]
MQKYSWKALLVSGVMVLATVLASCQQKPAEHVEAASTATPAKAAAYICPMGCEGSASDKPGNCPVCDMKLEPNPAAQAATVPTDSL